ncbi:MAG TPA: PQQ-binding-like beta-propeller repeat protein, partial [Polyangiales bacterium]|nr:PQQ-binding-like beta-propeller repeat protein [Polyangiales bacterium]
MAGPATAASVATYTTGGEIESSPAIDAQGVIYFGSFDGFLYALNPDLSLKWRFATGAPVRSSPALAADGTIVVGSHNGRIYAIKPDGTQKWQYTTGGPVWSSPTIGPDGTIYVGSDDFYIYALNAVGTLKWRILALAVVRSTPAISPDGTIYAGADDWSLTAILPNGTVKWVSIAFGPVSSSPAIGPDGTIYVGSYDGYLYALHPGTGAVKWAFRMANGAVTSSPAIAPDGSIVFGNDNGTVYAVRPDGTLKWSRATGGIVYSSPAIDANGVVYIGSYDNNLYALATATGNPLWTLPTGGDIFASPALSKGMVYVTSYDKKLYAVGSPCAGGACASGEGPCNSDSECGVGLVCGRGIAKRYGKPESWGICWNPGICATFDPASCKQPGSPCGTTCCVPDCGAAAGTPDGCGGTCPACVPGADSDRDGLLDCAERADGTRWTNPLVNNGPKAQQGATCHATPTCAALDSVATVNACFVPVETQDLSAGWDFNTTDLNVCSTGFGFAPAWHSCREDFGVRYEASILLQTSGRHCFEIAGLTERQCGALFINDRIGEFRIATGQGVKCLNLDAGRYPLRWFYETTSNTRNELHIRHCTVTSGTSCVPVKVPPEDILPQGEHPPNLCDISGCSALCPCNDGEVCDPTKPNGFCEAHLRCQTGPGPLFGRAAQTPVCYDPACNPSSPTMECGTAGDRCGNTCPTCSVTPSCANKSCGSDGCYGSCGATCGAGKAGCATDADCQAGLVCLV